MDLGRVGVRTEGLTPPGTVDDNPMWEQAVAAQAALWAGTVWEDVSLRGKVLCPARTPGAARE